MARTPQRLSERSSNSRGILVSYISSCCKTMGMRKVWSYTLYLSYISDGYRTIIFCSRIPPLYTVQLHNSLSLQREWAIWRGRYPNTLDSYMVHMTTSVSRDSTQNMSQNFSRSMELPVWYRVWEIWTMIRFSSYIPHTIASWWIILYGSYTHLVLPFTWGRRDNG